VLKTLTTIDHRFFIKINGEWHNPFLDTFLPLLRQSYLWIPLYFFLLVFAPLNFGKRGWLWSLFFIITASITDLISSRVIKGTVLRLRPCQNPELAETLRLIVNYCPGNSSFTSSHAANHFAVAMFIYTTFKKDVSKWWGLLFAWGFAISYTQVYVGIHYPLDVAGGAAVGCIIGYITAKIFIKKIGLYNLSLQNTI
jgi:undecaprenyl-diphosphatase